MGMKKDADILLALVSLGLGAPLEAVDLRRLCGALPEDQSDAGNPQKSADNQCDGSCDQGLCRDIDWNALLDFAVEQGMASVACDGIQRLSDAGLETSLDLPRNEDIRYEWYGQMLTEEGDAAAYRKTLGHLFKHFADGGVERVMVMKGYSMALYYPEPMHRTFGDIDVYALGNDATAAERLDALLAGSPGYEQCDSETGRHSHASFEDISVENHYHFTTAASGHRCDEAAEEFLVSEAALHSGSVTVEWGRGAAAGKSATIYVPSADFNAVFLMWHMANHFVLENVNLRQMCDWWMFLRAESSNVDWPRVLAIWESCGISRFARIVNGALITYLGMDPALVPGGVVPGQMTDQQRFLNFVLYAKPLKTKGVEAVLKYWRRRWNTRVAHNESWLSALWRSVRSHL